MSHDILQQNHMDNRNLIKSISIKAKTMSVLKLMSPMKTDYRLLKYLKCMIANLYCIATTKKGECIAIAATPTEQHSQYYAQ